MADAVMEKVRKAPVRRSVEERRAELIRVRDMHKYHITEIESKLAALNGAVTNEKVLQTTQKWLEAMSVPALHAQAQRVGIDGPEHFDDLDELIQLVLVKMGVTQNSAEDKEVDTAR